MSDIVGDYVVNFPVGDIVRLFGGRLEGDGRLYGSFGEKLGERFVWEIVWATFLF